MKYIYGILGLIVLISTSTKLTKKQSSLPVDDRIMCEVECASRNLPCLSVVDKIVYEGSTEKSQIISKQTFFVCFKHTEESYPT